LILSNHTESPYIEAFADTVARWQFVQLNPEAMGAPRLRSRTGSAVRLARDGSNIAEYLLDLRRQDPLAFAGIMETLQYVLPYARDLQPDLTAELERSVYLQMTEGDFKIPGWLLSSGTLRILTLLALFRHPHPPPLIVIEEIENSLDLFPLLLPQKLSPPLSISVLLFVSPPVSLAAVIPASFLF
jgi:predicted ATPase